jgi:hypothetical protein
VESILKSDLIRGVAFIGWEVYFFININKDRSHMSLKKNPLAEYRDIDILIFFRKLDNRKCRMCYHLAPMTQFRRKNCHKLGRRRILTMKF